MFFNRTGQQQPQPTDAPNVTAGRRRPATAETDPRQVARRRAVALGMAVQLAVPMTGVTAWIKPSRAAAPAGPTGGASTGRPGLSADAAGEVDTTPALRQLFGTGADGRPNLPTLTATTGPATTAFAKGVDQLRAGAYGDAVATFKSIDTAGLNDADTFTVLQTTTRAAKADREQRLARAELSTAQQVAAAGQPAGAVKDYRAAAVNVFADADTRRQAIDGGLGAITTGPAVPTAAQPIHADVVASAADEQVPDPTAPATAPATAPVAVEPAVAPATVPTTPVVTAPVVPAPAPVAPVMPAAPSNAMADEQAAADAALQSAAQYRKIQLQQQQYKAEKLVEQARHEYKAGQKQDAYRDYMAAADLDPQNQQAANGRDEVGTELGVVTAPAGNARTTVGERIQQIRYRFNSEIDRANTSIGVKKFAEAQQHIDNARVARNNDPTLFTQQQLNDFDTTLTNTSVNLQTAIKADQASESATAATRTLQQEQERLKQYQEDQHRTVENLIVSARQYQDQGQYVQALATIDQIIRVDPSNQYALSVRQLVLDKATGLEQRLYQERFDREFEHQLNASKEEEIPYGDIVHYSDDWPSLSEMRDQEVKEDRGEGDQDTALQAQLDRHLPEVKFNANALSDVIDFLRDVSGANIYVDWKALEAANIAKDAPVTAKLRDIKFSKALELIFKNVEGDDDEHRLGYTVDEGVITISTRKELNKNTVTRRYDINDLLFVPPDYTDAPKLNLETAGQGNSGGGGGGGAQSQSLFTGGQQNQNQNSQQNREARIDEIKQYIQQNVDPNSWKDAGGDVGSVSSSPLRAILLITQTPENQHKIVSVLDSLRASQALQVSVETRFLTVQRNYLEDIGVNADFTFNPLQNPANSRSGYNSSRFSPIIVNQTAVTSNTTFTDANGNVVSNSAQGSRQLDWSSSVGNGSVPGSIAADPADYPNPISISGSYIDNMTVSFLIRAVEANQNSTQLTAPRLTLFSGQRAVIIVETQQAYVSDLTPVVAPGAALFDPTVSTTVATGVVLSVQATVSPDRKYVFLDLQPQLAHLQSLASFSISAVVTPVTTVAGVTTGASQIVNGTLQLPTIAVTQVKTSVSCPDGATLLLGGQTLSAETTREQGVPVLSKIPFLKRLFTARASSQDEQILLILVKPTILIQREQEQKQFPQLSSKLAGSGT